MELFWNPSWEVKAGCLFWFSPEVLCDAPGFSFLTSTLIFGRTSGGAEIGKVCCAGPSAEHGGGTREWGPETLDQGRREADQRAGLLLALPERFLYPWSSPTITPRVFLQSGLRK